MKISFGRKTLRATTKRNGCHKQYYMKPLNKTRFHYIQSLELEIKVILGENWKVSSNRTYWRSDVSGIDFT